MIVLVNPNLFRALMAAKKDADHEVATRQLKIIFLLVK